MSDVYSVVTAYEKNEHLNEQIYGKRLLSQPIKLSKISFLNMSDIENSRKFILKWFAVNGDHQLSYKKAWKIFERKKFKFHKIQKMKI